VTVNEELEEIQKSDIVRYLKVLLWHYARGWTDLRSNPGGGEIIRTRPDLSWGSHNLLQIGYWLYFPGVNESGGGADNPPVSGAEITERV